jgi:hypothetical protein
MIIFKYKAYSVKDCQDIINGMELPDGEFKPQEDNHTEEDGFYIVYGSPDFLSVFNEKDNMMELYGTKNTNSVNYYIKRFSKLDWDTWQVVRTKRWN